MLQFSRKQFASVGQAHLRQSLEGFLRRHLPGAAQSPPAQLRAAIDETLAECRTLGLTSQRAIAAYALGACALGSATLRADPGVQAILADRQLPQTHKSLLLQTWLAATTAALAARSRS